MVDRFRNRTSLKSTALTRTSSSFHAIKQSKERLKEIYQEISDQIMNAIRSLKMELDPPPGA